MGENLGGCSGVPPGFCLGALDEWAFGSPLSCDESRVASAGELLKLNLLDFSVPENQC